MDFTYPNLHLNLKSEWFMLILRGIKKEEYRAISPHWCSIFLRIKGEKMNAEFWKERYEFENNEITEEGLKMLKRDLNSLCGDVYIKRFNEITFSNGMTPPVPRFGISVGEIRIGSGRKDWGAERGKEYFVLPLGYEIL